MTPLLTPDFTSITFDQPDSEPEMPTEAIPALFQSAIQQTHALADVLRELRAHGVLPADAIVSMSHMRLAIGQILAVLRTGAKNAARSP